MSRIFKPRRGTTYTMRNTNKKSTVLAKGELFLEVPDSGAGTGASKLIVGDGTTAYENLPIAISGTTTSDVIADSSATATEALNNVISGREMANLFGSLKKAISLTTNEFTDALNSTRNEFNIAINDAINDNSSEFTDALNNAKDELNNTINERLNVNTESGLNTFYFDYKDGKFGFNTDPLRGADTFSPFSNNGVYVYGASGGNTTFSSPVSGKIYCFLTTAAAQVQWYNNPTSVSITNRVSVNNTIVCNASGSQYDDDRDAWFSTVKTYSGNINEGDIVKVEKSGGGNYLGLGTEVIVIIDGSILSPV